MSSLGVYSVDHEMSQIRAAFCVVLLLGGALGVAQTVLVLGCRYSWTISNYREVTWRVVIPRLTRVSRLSEIQSIARVDTNFRSRLAVQERYNDSSFFRVLSCSLQGVAERPLPCNYNVIE
jgi:hypothetical protein